MFKHCHLLLLIFFIQTVQLYSQTREFIIPAFADGAMSIPASGNEIILPPANATLQQLKVPPQTLNPGQILLRRRFSSKEYGLYQGYINSDSYTHLSAFLLPSKNSLKFVNVKFYADQSGNPDNDIENIYFDDGLIYVENKAKLFYFDSVWKKIDMLPDLPARLTINSEPQGADVYIDGVYGGTTPWNSGPVVTATAVIQLRKEGFYTQELFVNFFNGEIQQKHIILNKKVTMTDSTEIDPAELPSENTENIEELEQRIEKLEARIVEQKELFTQKSDSLLENYPQLSPKNEFEKNAQYEERKQRYEYQKISDLQLIKDKYQSRIASINKMILKTVEYKTDLESRIYTYNVPIEKLTLGFYDSENEFFPCTVAVNSEMFDFTLAGKIFISITPASSLKEKKADGTIKLSYLNKSVKINRNGQLKRFYYHFVSIKMVYKNEVFPVKCKLSFPEYITTSAEWQKIVETQRKNIKERMNIIEMDSSQRHNICIKKGLQFFDYPLIENDTAEEYCINVEGYWEFNAVNRKLSFLKITNVQDGAIVYVDGYKYCEIDQYPVLQINTGAHTVTVSKAGFRTSDFKVMTKPEDTVECKLSYAPLPAALVVTTAPPNARIELDDKILGSTPGDFDAIEPGNHTLKLTHTMYEPVIHTINLESGTTVSICDTFRNYSEEYNEWFSFIQKASNVNFGIAGLGKTIVNKNGLSISLMTAGVASDILLGYASYQCYSHSKKIRHSSSVTEKNYFSSRRREDIVWVVSTGLFSILDRLLTFKLTRSEVFK